MEFQEVLKRRTIRRFSQKPLKEEEFRSLIDAARVASCASNKQRLRYIVVRSPETVAEIFPLTAYAAMVKPKRNPVPGVSAPTAFLAVYSTEKPDAMIYADAGAAIQSLELAAWEKGIGCCWLGAFQKEKAAQILKLEKENLLFLVALGYADEKPLQENIEAGASAAYYLDDQDVLHVPKFSADAITTWI